MKALSVNQKVRTPFMIISTAFVVSGVIGLFLLLKVQESYDHYSDSIIRLERIYRSILTTERLVQGIQNEEDSRESSDFLPGLKEESHRFEELFSSLEVGDNNVQWAGTSLRSLLYSSDWKFVENFRHFQKLQNAIIKDLKRNGFVQRRVLLREIEAQTTKILDISKPLTKALKAEKKKIKSLRNVVLIGTTVLFGIILVMVFLFVYRPWKREYQNLEQERERLQGVLKESEIRGNTFSWEVNFGTKLTRRSNHLSGIFEFESESSVVELKKELSLFSTECQIMFEAALENCALKGEVFDIQVDLVTKNKKRYWLHYYAKRKQVGGETLIVGTVRDITHQKLAEERFKILFEQLKIPALIFGDGQIRNVNESGQRYFGINESREYSNLHPAILFPLYQLDGHSSLEKLKSALGETKEGKVIHQDWLFQLNNGKEVAGLISLFNIPYPTVDLHIMLIHDDSKRFEFERRLVDTNRKALHARRVKLEYITQMGVVLDELVDLVDTEIRENEKVELAHAHKLREIKTQLEYLWGENINHGLAESSSTVLTDFKSMMDGLHKRWTRSAKEKLSEVECKYFEDVDQYLWLDSIKLKLALNNLVMGAIDYKERSHIEIEVKTKFQNSRYGKISFLVKTTAKNWIQSDWTVLSQISNKPSEDKGIAAMRTSRIEDLRVRENTDFINLVELLQGEVFFDRDEETVGIGFSCAIERVIGVSSDILNDVTENPDDQENTISASEIWSHFGGDWDIIENTIKDFFDYYPTAISDLYYYLEDKNSEKILEISTDLYGVITHFPFFSAIERVVRIQKYSKYLHFDKIENELTLLNHELNSFHRALSDFLPQKRLKAA